MGPRNPLLGPEGWRHVGSWDGNSLSSGGFLRGGVKKVLKNREVASR